MAINLDTSLDVKIEDNGNFDDDMELKYEDVPEGTYAVELARVYKWRETIKDTNVSKRDDTGRFIKDEKGARVKEIVKDLKWYNADVVLRVLSGEHAGKAIKGSLSTHPDMLGSLKRFMYLTKLFGVAASEINKNLGVKVGVVTKNRTRTFEDKTTGIEKTITEPTVYYFTELPEDFASEDEEVTGV